MYNHIMQNQIRATTCGLSFTIHKLYVNYEVLFLGKNKKSDMVMGPPGKHT